MYFANSSIAQIPSAKLAIVFGREADGVSQEMITAADKLIYYPLHGFSESLNLSVSAALIMAYVLEHQPHLCGAMTENERKCLRRDWFLKLAKTPGQQKAFPEWATSQKVPKPFGDLRRSPAMRLDYIALCFLHQLIISLLSGLVIAESHQKLGSGRCDQ